MGLNNLKPAVGAKHRKKIVGRGVGSGHGRTATRGCKGQKARSGDGAKKIGFEGGQMPLYRRIPKRGFNNGAFRKEYDIVNIGVLNNQFATNAEITPSSLKDKGLVSQIKFIKILGGGQTDKSFSVKGMFLSKSAREKIKAAGGKVE
ncbi:MAG: 50S ribosomal protein L15 [Elusimicrobiota bacterium]|nr:50S ribosomal protein L15 [Elusimicrobiota bacterium]